MEKEIFENSQIAKNLANHKLPRYHELFKFDVFMTQLIDILDDTLSVFATPNEEKLLTQSMINNYVFKHIIEPPKQKKYSREQVAHLIALGILKQVLFISDIGAIIEAQRNEYPLDIAYDYFCEELEKTLKVTFEVRDFSDIEKTQPSKVTPLARKIRSAVLSFANKIYVQQSIYYEKSLNN